MSQIMPQLTIVITFVLVVGIFGAVLLFNYGSKGEEFINIEYSIEYPQYDNVLDQVPVDIDRVKEINEIINRYQHKIISGTINEGLSDIPSDVVNSFSDEFDLIQFHSLFSKNFIFKNSDIDSRYEDVCNSTKGILRPLLESDKEFWVLFFKNDEAVESIYVEECRPNDSLENSKIRKFIDSGNNTDTYHHCFFGDYMSQPVDDKFGCFQKEDTITLVFKTNEKNVIQPQKKNFSYKSACICHKVY